MGLLDSVTGSLPTISSDAISKTTNYAMSSFSNLASEASDKVSSTFGALTSPFSKLFGSAATKVATGKTATASANQINAEVAAVDTDSQTYKVSLRTIGDNLYDEVIFDFMPEVSEQRGIEYDPLQTPQMPGEFMKYKGTKATTWVITAILTCRTRDEATSRYNDILNLRGWSMPFFGNKQANLGVGLGAPPPVLLFSGYRGLVGTVPVVMTGLSWNWPKDCDWIPTNATEEGSDAFVPFPTVMSVTINLVESYSADQFNNFDLLEFRRGYMVSAFLPGVSTTPNSTGEAVGASSGISGQIDSTTPPGTEQGSSTETSVAQSSENKVTTVDVTPDNKITQDAKEAGQAYDEAKAEVTANKNSIDALRANLGDSVYSKVVTVSDQANLAAVKAAWPVETDPARVADANQLYSMLQVQYAPGGASDRLQIATDNLSAANVAVASRSVSAP